MDDVIACRYKCLNTVIGAFSGEEGTSAAGDGLAERGEARKIGE